MPTVLPIPGPIGQMMTQGALLIAFGLALMVNPRAVMRPNVFLLILTLAAVVAMMTSIHSEFLIGSTYRSFRYLVFVLVAWLLTPWWGRRDMLLLRCHRLCLAVVLGSVVFGAVLSPGAALGSGQALGCPLAGTATAGGPLRGDHVRDHGPAVDVPGAHRSARGPDRDFLSGVVMVATHTRTALIGLFAGLLVGGASLFLGNARVRRTAVTSAGIRAADRRHLRQRAADVGAAWSGQLPGRRELTGRTKVWSAVMSQHRPTLETWFGSGMSNMSFNGLPIDSNWVATFQDQGRFGIALEALIFLFLLVTAIGHARGPQKAISLFLIVYCLFASITEAGLDGPSAYLLDLIVAASLLVRPEAGGRT